MPKPQRTFSQLRHGQMPEVDDYIGHNPTAGNNKRWTYGDDSFNNLAAARAAVVENEPSAKDVKLPDPMNITFTHPSTKTKKSTIKKNTTKASPPVLSSNKTKATPIAGGMRHQVSINGVVIGVNSQAELNEVIRMAIQL